jgi:2-methylcitrate dehydratase PrpD
VTRHLAEFIAGTTYDGLPEAVRARLAALLIDYFRVGSVGLAAPWVARLLDGLAGTMGPPAAGLLYSDRRVDAARAAYVNGVIAGSLDWDDTHVGAMLHPGVVVWPAAIAIGQMVGAGGREIVAAAAAGYETMIRIGLAVQPAHFRRGYQSTATCGVFGAAAAAAKLLGLDAVGIRDALGIAGSSAGGVTQFFLSGSEVKRLHAGHAAACGVEAALFARAGLSGPPDVIEGRQGFANALAGSFDPAAIEDGLGQTFHLLRLQLKAHAVSARVLAAMEAAEFLARQGIRAGAIEHVRIGIPQVIAGRLTGNAPADLQQAQMSAPFAVAMALVLAGERPAPLVIGIDDVAAALGRADIAGLSRRTECVPDPAIELASGPEHVAASVSLTLAGGGTASHTITLPLGSPDRPMTEADLAARFMAAMDGRISPAACAAWLASLRHPAEPGWVDTLMSLRPGATRAAA